MGHRQVIHKLSVASATYLSPIFITKERCQLLTARNDKHSWSNLRIFVQENSRKEKSNTMVTFLHLLLP